MTERVHVQTIAMGGTKLTALLPGLALALGIAAAALIFRSITGLSALSPMIISIMLGLLIRNLIGSRRSVQPGIAFTMRRLLRIGIVLLGFQLTLADVTSLGGGAVAVISLTLGATFVAIIGVGGMLRVDRALTSLIAAGTAVCGASAVIAANTVSQGSEEDVAYAMASVTILGSVSMLIYPLLARPLGLDDLSFGLWTGATVHEVAQVAAASFQHSEVAGEYGTIAKLTRVVMLAPLVLAMAAVGNYSRGAAAQPRVPMPWFVVGFVALVIVNSMFDMPHSVREQCSLVTTFLLSAALAAMGFQTDIGKLLAKGLRPLALGVFGWLFIAAFGLAMLKLFGY